MLNNNRQTKPSARAKHLPPQRTRIVNPATELETTDKAALLVDATKSAQPSRFVFKPEVLDRVGVSYVTIWQWMRAGTFPVSREVGGKVAWLESEIDHWIATRPARQYKKLEAM